MKRTASDTAATIGAVVIGLCFLAILISFTIAICNALIRVFVG